MGKRPKYAKTALKILVSAALIYFIYTKLDINELSAILKKTNRLYLVWALLFFVLSKICASLRLNLYFHRLGVPLTQKSNLKLYWLGMFYNLFLPGGIGGDAYKGYIVNKKFAIKTKRLISALVIDRLSGLLILVLFACVFAMVLQNEFLTNYRIIFVPLIGLAIGVFWFLNKKIFPYLLAIFWKSFGYSILVQGIQLLSVICIMKALSIELQTITYLFIFMIASIVSVLPITIGGLGAIELSFYYGATIFGLDENNAIGLSILFFLVKAVVSLYGAVYHLKKPSLETVEQL